jgi:hypothetical protein
MMRLYLLLSAVMGFTQFSKSLIFNKAGLIPRSKTWISARVPKMRPLVREAGEAAVPTLQNMKIFTDILTNITLNFEERPEIAMSIISKEMGWLLGQNIPGLVTLLLQESPELRQDMTMMQAYTFMMDFLVAVTKETKLMREKSQRGLKEILEAARKGEDELENLISTNRDKFLSEDLLVYLDAEIENSVSESPAGLLLVTIKLRLLEEAGKEMSSDILQIPRLVAESNPITLRDKTLTYLNDYDLQGKELFLANLDLIQIQLRQKYERIDMLLLENLKRIETITKTAIAEENDALNRNT